MLQSSSAQTVHVVGDALGWLMPPGGAAAYTTWAANKTFRVGDILVFNFATGSHDVAKVTRADYNACSSRNPILVLSNGPANVTLNETGDHYFFCNFPGHCNQGQKLAINVSSAASSPAPQPATPPPSPTPQPSTPAPQSGSPSPTPAPARSPVTYTVGDTLGWTVPTGGASVYETWAKNKTFFVGDILVFNYVTGAHDVAEVTRQAYQSCNGSNPLSNFTTGPTRITLRNSGEHFYICAFPGHCSAGQKLAINVTGSSTATPPSSSPSPTPSPSTETPPSSSPTTPPPFPSSPSPSGEATPPPPAGNSATTLGVAGFSTTFLSLIVAFFM
ncbi:Plastocyanin-like protein [Corchorus capsularis]|uniref:Plastocyanin-like protein n=1 Tax=Corchorus capsularis TaxID=210143 RepID=A0A1R3IEU7_COCAP|nr:Plastocyanin-like protein [Corchorus capsularis]